MNILLDKVRMYLIKKLAGDRPVMLNIVVNDPAKGAAVYCEKHPLLITNNVVYGYASPPELP